MTPRTMLTPGPDPAEIEVRLRADLSGFTAAMRDADRALRAFSAACELAAGSFRAWRRRFPGRVPTRVERRAARRRVDQDLRTARRHQLVEARWRRVDARGRQWAAHHPERTSR